MPYINENNELIITWCLEDIITQAEERGIEITEEQAKKVLELLCRKHDCCIGINWDVIDIFTDHVLDLENNE